MHRTRASTKRASLIADTDKNLTIEEGPHLKRRKTVHIDNMISNVHDPQTNKESTTNESSGWASIKYSIEDLLKTPDSQFIPKYSPASSSPAVEVNRLLSWDMPTFPNYSPAGSPPMFEDPFTDPLLRELQKPHRSPKSNLPLSRDPCDWIAHLPNILL